MGVTVKVGEAVCVSVIVQDMVGEAVPVPVRLIVIDGVSVAVETVQVGVAVTIPAPGSDGALRLEQLHISAAAAMTVIIHFILFSFSLRQ